MAFDKLGKRQGMKQARELHVFRRHLLTNDPASFSYVDRLASATLRASESLDLVRASEDYFTFLGPM